MGQESSRAVGSEAQGAHDTLASGEIDYIKTETIKCNAFPLNQCGANVKRFASQKQVKNQTNAFPLNQCDANVQNQTDTSRTTRNNSMMLTYACAL